MKAMKIMAKKRTRGGYRQPANPAPVSGPGALSARTDGGPGSATQPIRRIPGVDYGEQQALSEQQAAAPLPAEPTVPSKGMATPRPPLNRDVFRPTDVPGEDPRTAGINPAEAAPDNTLLALKAMYQVSGFNPVISQLIHNYEQRGL